MRVTKQLNEAFYKGFMMAQKQQCMYFTPEHLLYAILDDESVVHAMTECNVEIKALKNNLIQYVNDYIDKVKSEQPTESLALQQLMFYANEQVKYSEKAIVGIEHVLSAFFELDESFALYYMLNQGVSKRKLLVGLLQAGNDQASEELEENESLESNQDDLDNIEEDKDEFQKDIKTNSKNPKERSYIKKFTTNLNEFVKEKPDKLVGREDLIQRTIHILCRRNKNNPIHIGEVGVGKTAITIGLANLINEGKVPKKLQGATIFSVEIGSLIAGTKYRGEFEERMKKVFNEIKKFHKSIVYIDEIHSIVGAGALGSGTVDASSLLKPYLTDGSIRFIGATTYDEYKKHFEKDKGLARRFQKVEVKETTVEETVQIIEQIKEYYEEFHQVIYTKKGIRAAVELSDKYINERFLPDKAIDIIDEAGAYIAIREGEKEDPPVIDEHVIEDVISRICHIPKSTVEIDEVKSLKRLEDVLQEKIFGQETAVKELVRCIKISRAGLGDDNKPVASMLFVGPTGVGKTELAKCLAKELGVDLIRFDMSEYVEKHTASKFIGTPAGYVGYEDGGLLTDAIRKKPHCVLLLDEIEKAHGDIHNLLLQIMDYATITDNQGRKIDFKNTIVIMTSNAGAKNIGKMVVGFQERTITGNAIHEEVNKVFSPEFRNRLDKIIAFNHINQEMAIKIANKELASFQKKLEKKNVKIKFNKECVRYIAEKGISKEFGAREIVRIVSQKLKPLLVDEILFGDLSNGGECEICISKEEFIIKR